LVRALGHETGAVQLYLAQAGLAAIWALDDESRQFRADGLDELGHGERVMKRLLELGVAPPAVASPPLRLGRSVEEMLIIDRELEVDVIRLYEQAGIYCARIQDRDSEELFAGLLREELEHLAHIDACLDEARSAGRHGGPA
jgi:bacterioferritin